MSLQQILIGNNPASGLPPLVEDNLFAAYRGENNTLDAIGSNHASAGSQTAYAAGQVGNAFLFNGNANSRVLTPSINLGSAYTIEFWMYRTGSGSVIVNNWQSNANFGGIYVDSVSSQMFYYFNSSAKVTVAAAKIPVNTWVKVSLTYNGSKCRFFVNEFLEDVEAATHVETFNNAAGLGFGITNTGSDAALAGRLDEVKFFTVAKAYEKLIAHYKGENNAIDTTSNALNATAGSQTAYATGKDGGTDKAFLFNGNSLSAVTVPLFFLHDKYTIEFYIYPTGASDYQHAVGFAWNMGGGFGTLYYRSDKSVDYWQSSASRAKTAANSVPLNTWTKIRKTYDGSKTRIYINDVLSATEAATHTESYKQSVKLGYATNGSDAAFTGRIDEVKFYNYVV